MISTSSRLSNYLNDQQQAVDSAVDVVMLMQIISSLEKDIAAGSCFDASYARVDLNMMPTLVEQANYENPGLNLKFGRRPFDLTKLIRDDVDNRNYNSRFIINRGMDGIHLAVIDFRVIDNKKSILLFEPAIFLKDGPYFLRERAKRAIEATHIPDCFVSAVEMGIQNSSDECGIFSLALAIKLHRASDNLEKMHTDNIKGALQLDEYKDYVPSAEADKYLPVAFYKHTQSSTRINKYLEINPTAKNEFVNKKNQTITDRFNNVTIAVNGKNRSISAHNKRIALYKNIIVKDIVREGIPTADKDIIEHTGIAEFRYKFVDTNDETSSLAVAEPMTSPEFEPVAPSFFFSAYWAQR